ncbi:MAG: glycosyltransferase, partial [Oxalobacteraceae bacterium]|nr:glycosyltransferase [Oxalobacteraceae bacterium]
YEGFGMATVDAMSCGCVPVVRPVGEMASYVDDSCGVLVTDPSPAGLRAAAERSLALLKDADQWHVLSVRARQSVSRYRLYTESYLEGVRRALYLK